MHALRRQPVPHRPIADRSTTSTTSTASTPRRARLLGLIGPLIVVALVAAGCGDGDSTTAVTQTPGEEAAAADAATDAGLMATRPGSGILAAGGTIQNSAACTPSERSAGADTVTIGYIGPDFDELAALGLETLVFDGPTLVLDAYVNEVNQNGGLNGRCFELAAYEWSLADPAAAFDEICAVMPPRRPVIVLTIGLQDALFECISVAARLPILGTYVTMTEAQFEAADGNLFVDSGSTEFLLAASVESASMEELVNPDDRFALLHGSGSSLESEEEALEAITGRLGFAVVGDAHIPAQTQGLGLVGVEEQVRLLHSGLTGDEETAAQQAWARLTPAQADTLELIERFYLDTAADFRDSGVDVVVTSGEWYDIRRLMRAAELIDWFPKWIISDQQHALVVLTNAPPRQANNLVQISFRRAAGDEIPDIDRGCISMRNTAVAAEPFAHRFHTDAWNMITATCEYLDVIFAAVSRVSGQFSQEKFMEELSETRYETPQGSVIQFGRGDYFANDRYRVLQADPHCVLDDWGCMRSVSGWIDPTLTKAGSACGWESGCLLAVTGMQETTVGADTSNSGSADPTG